MKPNALDVLSRLPESIADIVRHAALLTCEIGDPKEYLLRLVMS